MAFRYAQRTSIRARRTPGRSFVAKGKKPALGQGGRFRALKSALAKKGARSPGALASFIGRKKYGAKRFAQLSTLGRKKRR